MSFSEMNTNPLLQSIMKYEGRELEKLIVPTKEKASVAKIKILIREVMQNATPKDLNEMKIFLGKISYLNEFVIKNLKNDSLKEDITKLETRITQLAPPIIRSGRSLSMSSPPIKPSATPESASKAKTTGVKTFGTPLSFATVKESIKALSISDPEFAQKATAIKEDLNKLSSSEVTAEQKKELSGALRTLSDPYAFRASVFERNFLHHCAESHPKFKAAMDDFDKVDRDVQLDARSSLLKALQKKVEDPHGLTDHIKKLYEELPKKRISNMYLEGQPFNKHFVDHLPSLISAVEDFVLDSHTELNDKWKETAKVFDDKHKGQFSKMLKNYPYMNPAASFSEFAKMQQEKFFKLLDLNFINNAKNIKDHLSSVKTKSKEFTEGFFSRIYKVNYLQQHLWLSTNLEHIVKSYDQDEAIHTNLGEGVCFQNSLDRTAALLSKPELPDRELQTGSTQTGRYHQSKVAKEISSRVKEGRLTVEDLNHIESESATRLGMSLKESVKVAGHSEADLLKNLRESFLNQYKKNDKKLLCILGIFSEEGGHAINVQIDNTTKQYRFIDDNLGICSAFEKPAEFINAFIEYLSVFYPKTYEFDLQFYTPKSS